MSEHLLSICTCRCMVLTANVYRLDRRMQLQAMSVVLCRVRGAGGSSDSACTLWCIMRYESCSFYPCAFCLLLHVCWLLPLSLTLPGYPWCVCRPACIYPPPNTYDQQHHKVASMLQLLEAMQSKDDLQQLKVMVNCTCPIIWGCSALSNCCETAHHSSGSHALLSNRRRQPCSCWKLSKARPMARTAPADHHGSAAAVCQAGAPSN